MPLNSNAAASAPLQPPVLFATPPVRFAWCGEAASPRVESCPELVARHAALSASCGVRARNAALRLTPRLPQRQEAGRRRCSTAPTLLSSRGAVDALKACRRCRQQRRAVTHRARAHSRLVPPVCADCVGAKPARIARTQSAHWTTTTTTRTALATPPPPYNAEAGNNRTLSASDASYRNEPSLDGNDGNNFGAVTAFHVTPPGHDAENAAGAPDGLDHDARARTALLLDALPELPASRISIYTRVARYLVPHRAAIVTALSLTVASTGALLAIMRLFGSMSALVGRGSVARVLRYAVYCAALLAGKCAAQYGQDVLLANVCTDVTMQLRRATVDKVLALGLDERDGADSGELVYRATAEIDRVGGACIIVLRSMLPSVVQFLGLLGYMTYMSPLLTVGVLATAPIMAAVYGTLERRLESNVRAAHAHMSTLATQCTESFRHVRLVQAYSAQRMVMRSFDSVAEQLRAARKRADAVRSLISPAVTLCYTLVILTLLWMSAISVARGRLTAADLITFLTCVALLIEPIQLLVSKFGELKEGEVAAARMLALFAREPRIRDVDAPAVPVRIATETAASARADGTEARRGGGGDGGTTMELRDVWYSYDADEVAHKFTDGDGGSDGGDGNARDDPAVAAMPAMTPALRGVNLHVDAGETVALVGGSGAGKSTLVALLSRLRDPARGAVLFDGTDARAMRLRDVRARVAVVPQDAPVLSGTVRDNIVFGLDGDDDNESEHESSAQVDMRGVSSGNQNGAESDGGCGGGGGGCRTTRVDSTGHSDAAQSRRRRAAAATNVAARVERAARAAHAHEFITRSLRDGYATAVGEGGASLSGGQRQRLAIARAFYRDAPVLVLDEATSALDAESERLVRDALARVRRDAPRKTVLIITHRLATLRNVDRIVVMERGALVEQGTHEALMARTGGRYAALFAAQQLDTG